MTRNWSSVSTLLLALLLAPVSTAWGDWVDDGVPVCTASDDQFEVIIVSDGAGGAIIAWTDLNAGYEDLYAQRIDGSGNTLWIMNGVPISTAGRSQRFPDMIPDGSGGAIIVWTDYRNYGGDVYAQRVDGSGNVLWAPNGAVILKRAGVDEGPTVLVSDGSGGAILAWQYQLWGGHPNLDIYAQRIDASGNIQWATYGVPICTIPTSKQMIGGIASDNAGGAIIKWSDNRNGNWDIYAQRVDPAGNAQWTTHGVPICTAPGDQGPLPAESWGTKIYGNIVPDGSGGAVIPWHDLRGSDRDIYVQRVDSSGNTQWTADGVAVCTAAGDQECPTIVADNAGGWIVAWSDQRSGTSDIYIQHLDASGDELWGADGVGVCTASGDQEFPTVVSDGAGGAIITWVCNQAGDWDVYAQRVDASGNVRWGEDGVALCTAPGDQGYPVLGRKRQYNIVSDDSRGAIVTWHDGRSSDLDIYAQKIEIPYEFDIKPGSCPNPLNITGLRDTPGGNGKDAGKSLNKGGVLPTAIVGSESFDVTEVDVSTLLLEGIEPLRHAYEDVTRPGTDGGECTCTPEGPDGIVDLTLKFSCKDIAGAIGDVENGDVVPLTITGSLTDGTAFEASDCVLILSKGQNMPSVAPEGAGAQSEFKLGPIAPNPFKGVTRITYELRSSQSVKLSIYDAAGRLVRILADEVQGPGEHVVEWDAGRIPSGIYFCRLEIGQDVKVKRIRFVR